MSYRDSMITIEGPNGYSIGLIKDTLYNPDSADNAVACELAITRLGNNGKIIWAFSGGDIFATPTVRDGFLLRGDIIESVNWDGIKFTIEAHTAKAIKPQL